MTCSFNLMQEKKEGKHFTRQSGEERRVCISCDRKTDRVTDQGNHQDMIRFTNISLLNTKHRLR